MSYIKEKSSKINHQNIIKNEKVKEYLRKCFISNNTEMITQIDLTGIKFNKKNIFSQIENKIKYIIAVDGGYQIVELNTKFPSTKIAFYNVGYIEIDLEKIKSFEKEQIIDPDEFHQVKHFGNYNFVLPVNNIKFQSKNLKDTIRETIYYDIFVNANIGEFKFLDTLKWLVFEEYDTGNGIFEITCVNDNCNNRIKFEKKNTYTDEVNNKIECPVCKTINYITDIFELHTLVDDYSGASGIVSYVMSIFEVILLFTIYKIIYIKDKSLLPNILLIKDGPLALFSRLDDFQFKKIRPFIKFLNKLSLDDNQSYVNFVGLDKSGLFVEHLKQIEYKLSNSTLLIPDIYYMKKYITGETDSLFGYKTYFGRKMLYKHDEKLSFVFDIPLPYLYKHGEPKDYEEYFGNKPNPNDFINIKNIIQTLIDIKCDLYDNSFLPIALINKAVSLSEKPSSQLLKLFTKEHLKAK
ncbi:conserved hypothetical protein (plasmid) [Deferribacter desulfuricans SSM1]|uniref:Uncharacterized protein n=1 Tax=Deferribacter desulfuricans (strain DSM 14783 / JCM 11476 / NBRC 101012 / SSM1) TaxID=639282 RepID=D3PEX2_DEFDS|nr:DNA double-strand break repair nuclease NurA [Deferribacter desulfuricans]BAI81764.1 conserved hypothetical protein [Deferribacter desulfuricans SSM1]